MAQGIKTGGREKGTPNKLTIAIRETLAEVLQDYTQETLTQDLDSLSPEQRIKAITNLYRLSLPPMKADDQVDAENMKPLVIKIMDMSKATK